MRFPTLRLQTQHKFVRQLKKFLNELVTPSPTLNEDDNFDKETEKAVADFKKQWMPRLKKSLTSLNNKPEGDLYTWSYIGEALGIPRLRKELSETQDYELRTLLLGMDAFANEVTYYTKQMEACDAKIASILGGKNAIAAANGFEPEAIALLKAYNFYRGDTRNIWRDGSIVIGQGHLAHHMMHLYGSTDGTRLGVDGRTYTDIYIPAGFEPISNVNRNIEGKKNVLTQKPTHTQAIVTFYFKRLGNITDATLLLMHVKDFRPVKQGNRWRIGQIGGRGGELSSDVSSPYLHSHFVLVKGDVGLAIIKDSKGRMNDEATNEYRASIGIRFRDAFC